MRGGTATRQAYLSWFAEGMWYEICLIFWVDTPERPLSWMVTWPWYFDEFPVPWQVGSNTVLQNINNWYKLHRILRYEINRNNAFTITIQTIQLSVFGYGPDMTCYSSRFMVTKLQSSKPWMFVHKKHIRFNISCNFLLKSTSMQLI